MIIFGTKGRRIVEGMGNFYCPRCAANRSYERVAVKRYFTLFFIPLFPTNTLGEYIECKVCFTTFETEVLKLKQSMQNEIRRFVDLIKDDLSAGMPINAIYQQLIQSGASKEAANTVIGLATDGKLAVCNKCQLLYAGTMAHCSNCGGRLSNPT